MLSSFLCLLCFQKEDYGAEVLQRVHQAAVSNKLEKLYESTYSGSKAKNSDKAELDYLITFYVYYRQILYGSRRIPKNGLHDQISVVLPRLEKAVAGSKSDSLKAFYCLVSLTDTKNGYRLIKGGKEGKFSIRKYSPEVSSRIQKLLLPLFSNEQNLPVARFTNASYRFYSEPKVTDEQLKFLSETAEACKDTPWELEAYNYLLMNETAKYGKFSDASQGRALAALKKYKGTIYAEAWEQTRVWWETNKF